MEPTTLFSITPVYIAILGLLFIIFTLRVGAYRVKSNIHIGEGEDPEMLRRIRGQGNFIETVPMALFLLISMEVLGASSGWLHSLCTLLVLGRILHYIGLCELGPLLFRGLGMGATTISILVSSIWIFYHVLI